MIFTIIDPFLYSQLEEDQLVGINESYVDDLLLAGTDNWKILSNDTFKWFEATENQQTRFTFAKMHIIESENLYHIDQDFYVSKIEQIPSDAEFSQFASMRMKLG